MRPFFWRYKVEIVDGTEIKGSAEFLRRTKEALTLLRSTPFSHEIQKYVSVIEEGERSGMSAYARKPTFTVGKATWQNSPLWYAGTIAHDAYHSKLYHEAKVEGNSMEPHPDSWTGMEAEKKCLAFQRQVLEELKASHDLIVYVRGLQRNPTYQGRNKGWCAWWDYLRRKW